MIYLVVRISEICAQTHAITQKHIVTCNCSSRANSFVLFLRYHHVSFYRSPYALKDGKGRADECGECESRGIGDGYEMKTGDDLINGQHTMIIWFSLLLCVLI